MKNIILVLLALVCASNSYAQANSNGPQASRIWVTAISFNPQHDIHPINFTILDNRSRVLCRDITVNFTMGEPVDVECESSYGVSRFSMELYRNFVTLLKVTPEQGEPFVNCVFNDLAEEKKMKEEKLAAKRKESVYEYSSQRQFGAYGVYAKQVY